LARGGNYCNKADPPRLLTPAEKTRHSRSGKQEPELLFEKQSGAVPKGWRRGFYQQTVCLPDSSAVPRSVILPILS